ncbi:MAG: WD40 repeat domain-containing protein [Gemmataceae bacterium]
MPPKTEDNPLTPQEAALIERWILEGAKGPAADASPMRATVTLSAPFATVVPVRAVAVAADRSFVAASRANLVTLYDPKTGSVKRTLIDPLLKSTSGKPVSASHVSLVESMAVSPDAKLLATGSFREVTVWDIASGAPKQRISGFAHTVVGLAFSPDGKWIAASGGVPTEDGEVKIIEVATGKVVNDIKRTHSDTVFGVAFSPDGKKLATASADKFAKVWELPDGKNLKNFEGHTQHVLDVAWTPDGKRIVSAGADSMLKVWDLEKGEKIRDIPGFGKQVTRLFSLTATPAVLAAAGDGTVRLVNLDNGNTIRSYPAGGGFLYAVAGSPDGDIVIAGGEDGIVRIYEGKTGKVVKEIGTK